MDPRISAVSLGVSDLARSRAFYTEGLSLPERAESNERRVFYQLRSGWLCLFPRETLAQLAGVDNDGSGFSGVALSHSVKERQQVDEVLRIAAKVGGTLVRQADDHGQSRSGYFADPDGYLWEVSWTPQWPELSR